MEQRPTKYGPNCECFVFGGRKPKQIVKENCAKPPKNRDPPLPPPPHQRMGRHDWGYYILLELARSL